MKSLNSFSILLAFGILTTAANTASAQSLDSGSITMGSNGPVGSLSGTVGSVSGNVNFGAGDAGSSTGSFGFSLPGNSSSTASGFGPQGQTPGGYSSGIGSFGSAYSSQGATGDQTHDSDNTNTRFQGDSRKTRKQNNSLRLRMRNNLTATGSVDPRSVPSAQWDYGFKQGNMGTVRGIFTRGWFLPKTSTASFDGNIVSP